MRNTNGPQSSAGNGDGDADSLYAMSDEEEIFSLATKGLGDAPQQQEKQATRQGWKLLSDVPMAPTRPKRKRNPSQAASAKSQKKRKQSVPKGRQTSPFSTPAPFSLPPAPVSLPPTTRVSLPSIASQPFRDVKKEEDSDDYDDLTNEKVDAWMERLRQIGSRSSEPMPPPATPPTTQTPRLEGMTYRGYYGLSGSYTGPHDHLYIKLPPTNPPTPSRSSPPTGPPLYPFKGSHSSQAPFDSRTCMPPNMASLKAAMQRAAAAATPSFSQPRPLSTSLGSRNMAVPGSARPSFADRIRSPPPIRDASREQASSTTASSPLVDAQPVRANPNWLTVPFPFPGIYPAAEREAAHASGMAPPTQSSASAVGSNENGLPTRGRTVEDVAFADFPQHGYGAVNRSGGGRNPTVHNGPTPDTATPRPRPLTSVRDKLPPSGPSRPPVPVIDLTESD